MINPKFEYREIRNKFEHRIQDAVIHDLGGARPYDLEERTAVFAEQRRALVRKLHRTVANIEDAKQFIRASGSIGANYIEANDAIGKKDFLMKVKICRREAKESGYWLRLLDVDVALEPERQRLIAEAKEIMKIFGAIVRKCK